MNREGILAVESVLKEARRIAKTLPQDKRTAIEELCAEIDAMTKELADLQAQGMVMVLSVLQVKVPWGGTVIQYR